MAMQASFQVNELRATGLAEALVVPQLAQECCKVMRGTARGHLFFFDQLAGSGLKELRLISKAVRNVLHLAIQGYTMHVGGQGQPDSPALITLFKHSSVLSLRIVVPGVCCHPSDSRNCCIYDCTHPHKEAVDDVLMTARHIQHSEKMNSFLTDMGPSLRSLTHLHLILPVKRGCDDRETAATRAWTDPLLPLASLCPHLVQLTVHGRFGPSLLQQFGSRCPHLTSFHANLANLTTGAAKQLGALLPNLTDLGTYQSCYAMSVTAVRDALHSLPQLLSLDAPLQLSKPVWDAIPEDLVSLVTQCPTYNQYVVNTATPLADPSWRLHPFLTSLTLTNGCEHFDVLASILTAAPSLSVFIVEQDTGTALTAHRLGTYTCSSAQLARQLCIVNAWLEDGVILSSKGQAPGDEKTPINLLLHIYIPTSHPLPLLLTASLPDLSNFKHLELDGGDTSVYRFSNRRSDQKCVLEGDLSQVARVFTGLHSLKLELFNLHALPALASCSTLQHLELCMCDGVSRSDLEELCCASKSLRSITCFQCGYLTAEDKHVMEVEGWGQGLRVSVNLFEPHVHG